MNRSSSLLFWFGLVIATSVALYHTSDRVQELTQELHQLQAASDAERESIHVLKAEWVYLANPERVEKAAKHYLALRPSSPQQVLALDEFRDIMPTRSEAMAAVAISASPLATVRTSLAALPPRTSPLHGKSKTFLASANDGHLNDHMIMQRTASAEPSRDRIGTLINTIGTEQ